MYCHQKDIGNDLDGCIKCLATFFCWICVWSDVGNTDFWMEGDENDKERIECMVCLLQVIFVFWSNLISQFVFLCCTSHCILSWSSRHMPIDPSKFSYCFWTSIGTSLTLHVSLLFLQSNRNIYYNFSFHYLLNRIQWIDKSQSWRQRE